MAMRDGRARSSTRADAAAKRKSSREKSRSNSRSNSATRGRFSKQVALDRASIRQTQLAFNEHDALFTAGIPLLQAGECEVDEFHLRQFQRVLEDGSSPHKWSGPETPLLRGTQVGSSEMVRLLLQHKANAQSKDSKGVPVLHTAAFQGHLGICQLLLDGKAEVDAVDRHGQTPLFFAANKETCDVLFDASADPSIMNVKGQSALHLAARAGMEEVVKWLTEHCSRLVMDLRDVHGATATYYARAAGLNQRVVHRVATFQPDLTMISGSEMERHPHFAEGVKVPKWAAASPGGLSTPGSSRSQSSPVEGEGARKKRASTPKFSMMVPAPTTKPVEKAQEKTDGMVEIKVDLEDAAVGRDILLAKGKGNREITMHMRKANKEHARLAWVQEQEQKEHEKQIRAELLKERKSVEKEREKHRQQHEKELRKMRAEIEKLKQLKAEAVQGQQALKELEKVREEIKEIKEAKFQALQLVEEIQDREKSAARREDWRANGNKRVRYGDQPARPRSGYENFPDSPVEEQAWRIRHYGRSMPGYADNDKSGVWRTKSGQEDSDEDEQMSEPFVPATKEDQAALKIQAAARRSLLKKQGMTRSVDTSAKGKGSPTRDKKGRDKDSSKGGKASPKMKSMKSMREAREKKIEAEEKAEAAKAKSAAKKRRRKPPRKKMDLQDYRVDPRTDEEIQAEETAAMLIQRKYRASIVKNKLKDAPTDGTWALTKALRNQLAVRDYKAVQDRRRADTAEALSRTYRSSIAEKILAMEDKEYAMKKQAESYEQVLHWEMFVRGMQKNQQFARGAAALAWVEDQRAKNPNRPKRRPKTKTLEERLLAKYGDDLTDEVMEQEKAALKIQSQFKGKQARQQVEAKRMERRKSRFTSSSLLGDEVSVVARDALDAALKAWCGAGKIDAHTFHKVYGKERERDQVELLCHEAHCHYTHVFSVVARTNTYIVRLRLKGNEESGHAGHVGREWAQLFPPDPRRHASPKRAGSPKGHGRGASPKAHGRGVSPAAKRQPSSEKDAKRQPSSEKDEAARRHKSPKPKEKSQTPRSEDEAAKKQAKQEDTEAPESEEAVPKKQKKDKKEKGEKGDDDGSSKKQKKDKKSEEQASPEEAEDASPTKQKKDKKDKKEKSEDADADDTAAAGEDASSKKQKKEKKDKKEDPASSKSEDTAATEAEDAASKKLKKEKKEKKEKPLSEDQAAEKIQAAARKSILQKEAKEADSKRQKKDKKEKDDSSQKDPEEGDSKKPKKDKKEKDDFSQNEPEDAASKKSKKDKKGKEEKPLSEDQAAEKIQAAARKSLLKKEAEDAASKKPKKDKKDKPDSEDAASKKPKKDQKEKDEKPLSEEQAAEKIQAAARKSLLKKEPEDAASKKPKKDKNDKTDSEDAASKKPKKDQKEKDEKQLSEDQAAEKIQAAARKSLLKKDGSTKSEDKAAKGKAKDKKGKDKEEQPAKDAAAPKSEDAPAKKEKKEKKDNGEGKKRPKAEDETAKSQSEAVPETSESKRKNAPRSQSPMTPRKKMSTFAQSGAW